VKKRQNLLTVWFVKGNPSERVSDIMGKYSRLVNVVSVGDLRSGSDTFAMMENALLPLEQREEMFRMWTQADALISGMEQRIHDLREIVEKLKRPGM